MAFTQPTVAAFKAYFDRDFPFGNDIDLHVRDSDISKAQAQALFQFPESFWESQAEYDIGFNLLTAHHLVMNLRSSSQGINGQFSWLETSKSVSGVSTSQQIPAEIAEDPKYAYLTKTNYGTQYLLMILDQMVGNMFVVEGATRP